MASEDMSDTETVDHTIDGLDPIGDKNVIIDLVNKMDNRLSFVSRSGRVKSEVWTLYQRIYYMDKETHFVKCINCNDIKKQTKNLGTATLLRHHCLKQLLAANGSQLIHTDNDEDNDTFNDSNDEYYNDKCFLTSLLQSSDQRLSFESRNGKSEVWSRFERILFNHLETSYVKCKQCDAIQKQTSNTGTTPLLRHNCNAKRRLTDCHSRGVNNCNTFNAILRSKKCLTVEDKIRVENQTLKHLIKKCLDVIDKCLCVKRSVIFEKKQINVLIKGYNEWLFESQELDQLDDNKEEFENMFDNCFDSNLKVRTNECEDQLDFDEDYNQTNESKHKPLLISRRIKANSSIAASKLVMKKYHRRKSVVASEPMICDWPECGKQFRNSHNFQQHRNKHMGIHKYGCDWPGCEETFAKKVNYEMHMSLHTNEKKFKCDFPDCHYESCRNNLLQRHMKVHTGEKPFKCDWPGCEFRTSNKNGLRHHNYRHTGEKPWKCDWVNSDGNTCNWSFRQSTHLKAHRLKHTGERPYRCEWPNGICERKFASRQAMRFHSEKSHNYIVPQK